MDKVYNMLRKTEAIIFDSQDEKLKDFLALYYAITTSENKQKFNNILVYTDTFKDELLLISGVTYVWCKNSLPIGSKHLLTGDFVIEKMDIKQQYIQRFLSNCT